MDAAMTNQDILAMIRQEIAANNAAEAQARSFSQGTTNFGLPQWEPNDKPTFLVDMNGAYRTIDTQMQANKNDANSAITAAESANTLSNQALTASRENAQNIVTLNNNLTQIENQVNNVLELKTIRPSEILYNKVVGSPTLTYFSKGNLTGITPLSIDIHVQNVGSGTVLSEKTPLMTFSFPDGIFRPASNYQWLANCHWYGGTPQTGYYTDVVYRVFLNFDRTTNSLTFFLPANFKFQANSLRYSL